MHRLPYRSIETKVEEDESQSFVGSNGHVANGIPKSTNDQVHEIRKPAVKDVPSCYVAVTALGKLGLIMAYFYLCDR